MFYSINMDFDMNNKNVSKIFKICVFLRDSRNIEKDCRREETTQLLHFYEVALWMQIYMTEGTFE